MHLIPEPEADKRLNLPQGFLATLRHKGLGPSHVFLLRKAFYTQESIDAWVLSQMTEPSTANTTTATATTPSTTATPTAVQSEEVSQG